MAVPRKTLLVRTSGSFLVTCTVAGNRTLVGQLGYLRDPVDHRPLIELWLQQICACFCISVQRVTISTDRVVMLVHIDADAISELSDADLLTRWNVLYPCDPNKSALRQAALANPLKNAEIRAKWHCLSAIMSHVCRGLTTRINKIEQIGGRLWEARFRSAVVTDDAVEACVDVVVAAGKVQQAMSHSDALRRSEQPATAAPLTEAPMDGSGFRETQSDAAVQGLLTNKLKFADRIAKLLPRATIPGSYERLAEAHADTKTILAAISRASGAFVQDLLDWICCPKQLYLGGQKSLMAFAEKLLRHSIPVPKRLKRAIDEARLL
jgi:hypothetical protein